ncbi:MAG TPA: HAMP domain-containing sensor histidine kinase [Blastocatellia bacterium]|nr:HAMP domain-containing sensor histidine kinase [Blastocatellia bacterium]
MIRHLAASLKSGWTWGFGLFIAAPALLLALLGLRAVHAERIEREQQVREQQAQIARLADAALMGVWSEMEQSLLRSTAPTAQPAQDFVFTFTAPDELVFQQDKVWYGETTALPERAVNWSFATQQLIEQAQAAAAQGRVSVAERLYRRLSQVEPKLRGWAEFCLARNGAQQDVLTLFSQLLRADESTPTGLPVALLLCPYVEQLSPEQRASFAGLLRQTLDNLRQGHWWLSFDERQFYDAELCRLLQSVTTDQPLATDARMDELAVLARIIRRSPPVRREGATHSFEPDAQHCFLLFYAPSPRDSGTWHGRALPPARMAEVIQTTLTPLLSGQPFAAALRTAQGDILWSNLPDNATVLPGAPLRSISGWEIAFSHPVRPGWGRAWLWYGFILLLVVMLLVGLAMTARVVQREMELSRLQNEFIAAISHEFKSPLTSIRLLMERLTSGRLHEAATAHEYHRAINRETARLERLVNRLLESQQIQAGRKQYHFIATNLGEIAATAVAQLQPQAEAKGIRLETAIEPALPLLPVDHAALLDALENLLDNAIKYSPTGTCVKLTAQANGEGVCLDVHDEGIGIEPGDLPRIFDRFYRGQPGNQHSVKGTGLGLALVKAAVEAHGGSVTVASQPGQGSRFTLQFPHKEVAHNGTHSGGG